MGHTAPHRSIQRAMMLLLLAILTLASLGPDVWALPSQSGLRQTVPTRTPIKEPTHKPGGGGSSPTDTPQVPTSTPEPPTATPSTVYVYTPAPTRTPTHTPTATPEPATATPSRTPSRTPTMTATASPTPSTTPSATPTPDETATAAARSTATPLPSPTPTPEGPRGEPLVGGGLAIALIGGGTYLYLRRRGVIGRH